MGGFTSITEGLPSGNSTTASGVPLGNADFSFTPASSSFAMPEPVDSGAWGNDAFAPAQAMTQQMPEPNDVQVKIVEPETVGWKPATLQETQPRHQLAENAFAPATQSREDKVDPIVSKLAREHQDNPVPLRGSLLGAPETPKPAIKPPNPLAKKDDWPVMPKVDWLSKPLPPKQAEPPRASWLEGPMPHQDIINYMQDAYRRDVTNYLEGLKRQSQSDGAMNMRAYPQQQDPRPDASSQKPSDETQVAAGPAAALAAPYVVEGAAALSAGAAAYWAAHPELHPKEPNWFSKMLGKNETSVIDPETAKPKIETFPAEAGKPPALEGQPVQTPQPPNKEALPANPPQKGDNIIHEQRPSKVELPIATEIRKIAPVELGKGKSHPDMDREIGNIADETVREKTMKSIYGNGTLNGIDGEASNVVAPPVPKGQEYTAAKKDWEAFIRDVGGDPRKIERKDNGTIVWKSDKLGITANLHPSTSRDGQPTFEVQTEKGDVKFKHKRRYFSE